MKLHSIKLLFIILHFAIRGYSQDNLDWPQCLDAKDSIGLTHVKGAFYKSKEGHLYQKSIRFRIRDSKEETTVYFNAQQVPKGLDPMTFKEDEDGAWYATAKNFAYFYKGTSDGMQIIRIKKAKVSFFKAIDGDIAVDNKHVFYWDTIVKGLNPNKLEIVRDEMGSIIQMSSGKTVVNVADLH